jgi:acetyl-CoA carboxylase biotin carboxyl carrier protein
MEMTPELIAALLEDFDASDWQEMKVTIGGDRLHVARGSVLAYDDEASATATTETRAPTVPVGGADEADRREVPRQRSAADAGGAKAASTELAPGSGAGSVPASDQAAGTVVTSPSVGLFWRAPSPGAPPFVDIGAAVGVGDTVAIVEVMKLMNQVSAPANGVVTAILVENGSQVEFGEPLIVIDTQA